MKIPALRVCIFGLLFSSLVLAPVRAADANDAAKPAAAKEAAEKPENPLHLTADERKAAGIELAKATPISLAPEVEAYGRVIDPAALVALLAEDETARAALAASDKELTRVKTLFQNGANASAQAVETAEANVGRDRAAADSAHLRLVASWGTLVNDPKHLEEIRSALGQGAVLARLDVLPGDEPASPLKSASITLVSGGPAVNAEILGRATVADPQVQGRGFLVLIREGEFPVNAVLRATLPGAGATIPAVVVPRSAIVYHEGSAWVYALEKDTFVRKLVTVGRNVDNGVALRSGVDANEEVVTTGAEELLAAELQAAGATQDERE
jgi:hypothetical protein